MAETLWVAYGLFTLLCFALLSGYASEERKSGNPEDARFWARLSLVAPFWPLAAAVAIVSLPFLLVYLLGKMVCLAFDWRENR